MGYELHIEREPAITLEEWKNAVNNVDDVRLSTEDTIGTNPITNEEICIPLREGDADIYFHEIKEWIKVFSYFEGSISFSFGDLDTEKYFELAKILKANVVGDEGEIYFDENGFTDYYNELVDME